MADSASSSIPELTYFNGPGRGNLTRLAFVAGGVEFKDTRHDFSKWSEIKADPKWANSDAEKLFGTLPIIEHDGHLVGTSIACAMYAAELGIWRENGFLGNTVAEQSKNRATEYMVTVTNEDLRSAMYKCLFGDDASKANGRKRLPQAVVKYLAPLERALARKTSTGPFFFSKSGPSLADIAVFDNVNSVFPGLRALKINIDKDYPKIKALVDAVGDSPRIKAYLDKQKPKK